MSVLIYVESNGSEIKKSSLDAVSYGAQVASKVGGAATVGQQITGSLETVWG